MGSIKKAIAAGIAAAGTGLITGATDGQFTLAEGIITIGGALIAFGSTWKVTNNASE